jgi:hypothetical protein
MRDPKLFYSLIVGMLLILLLTLFLLGCSDKQYVQSSIESVDTTDIRLVPVDKLQGIKLEVGQKLSIPDLDIEISKINDKELLVKTPVRREIRTETTIIPTKQVDKSRTYHDSFNKDKSKVKEVTKQVEKTKTVDKNINRFPWWILILALVVILLIWIIRKYKRLIIPWPFK